MNPVYLDLHIHTSNDPSNLNADYDLDTLIKKIKEKSEDGDFLISFTDHNTINEKVYLRAINELRNKLIVGVELHIQTHKGENTKAYHCHIYFNFDDKEITSEIFKDINSKLDQLYPNKSPSRDEKSIPIIQEIIEAFDEYDFVLLPHGGQTHATFDKAMPEGKQFDNAMQRSIYYNFFDGFTSRSDEKTEKTKKYLEKLGVHEFVNLLTCTDNYDPKQYPKPKSEETYKFIPTWMFATATFGGLRLSLSDNSRLEYSHEKPARWPDSIKSIKLKNDRIDIDIQLTPGLNVIIGESSSGKTLLVDTLYRKLTEGNFSKSKYNLYDIEKISVEYPDNLHPHFIEQNFVISVTRDDKKINEIDLIKIMLPDNTGARKKIKKGIKDLNEQFQSLFHFVEQVEEIENEINRIPILSALITNGKINKNILKSFLEPINALENAKYDESEYDNDSEFLDDLEQRLNTNPFIKHNKKLTRELKEEILEMRRYSIIENEIKSIVTKQKKSNDKALREKEGESQRKKQDFDHLISKMTEYYNYQLKFDDVLKTIASFSIAANSGKIEIAGYILSVENKFEINKDIVKDILNGLLLKEKEINKFDDIEPEKLFKGNFKNNLRGSEKRSSPTYKFILENINSSLVDNDKIYYKIHTPTGDDFDNMSPGLKTAIILELILNFEGDNAPLIIDQPEDNLATSYMNDGLVRSIKKMKNKKQIIFVSHSATIPMGGDAQNVILCENKGGKIIIKSNPLEGKVNDINMLDYIAKITDGGKSSIKKRFKKYNLKNFNA